MLIRRLNVTFIGAMWNMIGQVRSFPGIGKRRILRAVGLQADLTQPHCLRRTQSLSGASCQGYFLTEQEGFQPSA